MNRRDRWITVCLLLIAVAGLAAPLVGVHSPVVALLTLMIFVVVGVKIVGVVIDFVNARWRQ
jgi:hypothetical protein